MDIVDLAQWPALLTTVAAAGLVASRSAPRRAAGCACVLASNLLWVVWGWHDHAYALVALQFCLAALNMRGVYKNE